MISFFEVRNNDVSLRFSCLNYGKHLRAAVQNLSANGTEPLLATFATDDEETHFAFDGEEQKGRNLKHQGVFFENTDYPLRVKPIHGGIKLTAMYVAGHLSDAASDGDEQLLYGTLNFKNQVGRTDIRICYEVDGQSKSMQFMTEVLSYKMDYRTDMRQIITDIEQEYSMLSYSYLKQTYLSYKKSTGKSTDLIWWQIFQQCYEKIVTATRTIISYPKRRLKSEVRYERLERLLRITPEMENEYLQFKEQPHHQYRTEELYLSKDTIENRFLKYAIREMFRRFSIVREHIRNTLKVNDETIAEGLDTMERTLEKMVRHPFFHGIGLFRGFSQDSLVMKRGRGYSEILKQWLLLQCGYELEDSMNHLEVKDISELYEIWCFIKVKNMVQQILGDEAQVTSSGHELTQGFIRQLMQGAKSEVLFRKNDVELVTVSYNAQVEKDEDELVKSAIEDTHTFTTIQRPDIVLRLSRKHEGDIVYTYLFDAKYRLNDHRIAGCDVPPEDAINQMHRYRDAIYYDGEQRLKKEVIGGYVLYPGQMSKAEYLQSYYHTSIDKVGIGAYPLRPGKTKIDDEGRLIIDPDSSEAALYEQIKNWLFDEHIRENLLSKSIPQRGLCYADEEPRGLFFVSSVSDVRQGLNVSHSVFQEGNAKLFCSGYSPSEDIDLLNVKFFAPIISHYIYGYYRVENIRPRIVDGGIRIELKLGKYHRLPKSVNFGVDNIASKGFTRTAEQFEKDVEQGQINLKPVTSYMEGYLF